LAALAPALAAGGEAPDVVVGTSIGALNGAFLAARADEPLDQAVAAGLEMWRELSWGDALRPLASPWELGRLLSGAAMLAGLPGADLPGLLDSSPLRATLERLVAFERIASNVADGTLTAAAVVATAYATTRSTVFHHGGPTIEPDSVRAIDYAATPLELEHVLASAAIPGAFPAVEIRRPREAAGWYGDGGVRLNAPLKPAIALGADRVIVIGLNSSATPTAGSARPDAVDGVAQLLQVVLADQLADDVATLAAVNETLAAAGARDDGDVAAEGLRRTIPYIFVAPCDRFVIGRLARDVYRRHYAGIRGLLRDSNLALLGRIVNAERSPIHGELLSYLFLARAFIDELIALGRSDAERWLGARHDAGLWQVGQLPAGTTAPPAAGGRSRRPRPRAASA
jgi:NTE family protein